MTIKSQIIEGAVLDAIELLKARTSCAQLADPRPSDQQLETLYQVAFRAADHRQLKPVRFLQIDGEGLMSLGELFVKAKRAGDPDLNPETEAKTRAMPTRAPLVVVAIASLKDDPKVPEIEQMLSAGASVQNMLNAAFALGIGAIWRTGDLAFDSIVAAGLGLASHEKIIGFIYLGTPRAGFREAPAYDYQKHIKVWP